MAALTWSDGPRFKFARFEEFAKERAVNFVNSGFRGIEVRIENTSSNELIVLHEI